MDKLPVRTRFAPSPTGFLHVGSIRTALFAWFLARQNDGQFILRLEDTDKAREVGGSAEHIIESLKWLGINWEEGFDIGGKYGPYKQSERLDIYKKWGEKLIASGRAYADPYTMQEVEKFRQQSKDNKKPFLYRDYRPDNPPAWDGSQPLRFLSKPEAYKWEDAVMGKLSAGAEAVDDFVLIKADGYPTYNFAHIVDDAEMNITHVIRSQEFVSSTPRFLNLYEALEIERPILATLPFVMAIDGKKKLGKRDGAKDVLDYAREGILPIAMMNFLASLGWNDGTEQEIFSIAELIDKFSLDRVQKSPARFDEKRLWWMNGMYIRRASVQDLSVAVAELWPQEASAYPEAYKISVLALIQERLKKFDEIQELSWFFFKNPIIDKNMIDLLLNETNLDKNSAQNMLEKSLDLIKNIPEFSVNQLHDNFYALAEELNSKPGELFKLVRIAIVGGTTAPGLFETIHVLGQKTAMDRIQSVINSL